MMIITPDNKHWTLTFEDDFNGIDLDTTKWKRCPEQKRQDVGGWWKDSQSFLDGNGNLVLKASISEDGTPISGAVHSKGIFEQAYGYFECRMKMQRTSGFWGAFWLMTESVRNVGGGAVNGAEIDIIESGEFPRMGVNHAIHWDGYGKDHKVDAKIFYAPELYKGFHVYALEWTKEDYIFFVDGKETWRTRKPGICEVPTFLKLSVEFGSWAGEIVPEELPDEVLVDYVRVYQLEESHVENHIEKIHISEGITSLASFAFSKYKM